jgi:hypothetical protein
MNWADETNRILAEHGIADRIDHRSHANRGIGTVHEGVAARAMEKREIVADRCEWNREIRSSNRILRELKAKLDKLLQAIPQIAESLENIHSRLVILRYQILSVGQQKRKYHNWLDRTMPVIEQYKAIGKTIKAKTGERKDLQTERDKCTTIQFMKKHDLTVQINAVTEEIEDLKSEKGMLISKLNCVDDADVKREEQSSQTIRKELPGFDRREAELTEKEKGELEKYNEISSHIASADADAVWNARAELRPDKTANVEAVLRKGYGDKYDHSRLFAARREINDELGEKKFDDAALSARRKTIQYANMTRKTEERTSKRGIAR